MGYSKINELGNALVMSKQQREVVDQYPSHIIEHSFNILIRKINEGIKFTGVEPRIKYFMSILKSEADKKWRSYDPYEPLFEDSDNNFPITIELSVKKGQSTGIVAVDNIILESAGDFVPLAIYEPVVDLAEDYYQI